MFQAVCFGEDVRYVLAEVEGLSGLYVVSAEAREALSQTLGRRVTPVRELTGEGRLEWCLHSGNRIEADLARLRLDLT